LNSGCWRASDGPGETCRHFHHPVVRRINSPFLKVHMVKRALWLGTRFQTAGALMLLGAIGLGGILWNGTNLPQTSRSLFGTVLAADLTRALIFGIGLQGVGFLTLTRLHEKRHGLFRGAGRALLVAGGYVLVAGLFLAVQRALPWPGLPEIIRPLITLAYCGLILLAGRRHFFRGVWSLKWIDAAGSILSALGLGCFVSAGWPAAGALGTASELVLALLEALGMGLIGAIWMGLVFFDAPEAPLDHPKQAGLWAAAVFGALAPLLFAVRGWSTQGAQYSFLPPFFGVTAAGLLVSSRSRRNWGSAFIMLFAALALPLAFTKGAEGDWVPGGLPAAWGNASLFCLGVSIFWGSLLFLGHGWLERVRGRVALGGIVGLVGIGLALSAYFFAGQPGLQPETFFVVMADQANTHSALTIADLAKRRAAVFGSLTQEANRSQSALRAELDRLGVRYTPYYLVDGLEVYGTPGLRQELASRPDVARILDSPHMRPQPPVRGKLSLAEERPKPADLPWGITTIRADQVWQTWGISGQGVVVGSIGNGVDWRHPDLRQAYLGSEANHDYTWYDPWEHTREPIDTNGIGTHTLGTILGANGSGVAPGARWIACRSLARDLGNLPLYLDCMQFLFAPFPQAGEAFRDGDPGRGAQIVDAEFICPPYEGCDASTLSLAIEHLRHGGQMFVTGAGNEGPGCTSILPPGTSPAALTVGALGRNGQTAPFSGRGPVTADGSGQVKPDLVAPGVGIISDLPDARYAEFNGTSMAAAHVAGVAALLWSADPALAGDIDRTVQILNQTARHLPNEGACDGPAGTSNVSGAGLVDAFEAVKLARQGP
jgi:hypothetical protein